MPGPILALSHRFPYVFEVEYDSSTIFRQPPEMDFTPASNVLSHPFTGRLRPRHFAGECAHKPHAVSLHNSTVSKDEVRRVIVLFREIHFEYRSSLGVWHLAPALRPAPWSVYHSHWRSIRCWAGGHRTTALSFLPDFHPCAPIREKDLDEPDPEVCNYPSILPGRFPVVSLRRSHSVLRQLV